MKFFGNPTLLQWMRKALTRHRAKTVILAVIILGIVGAFVGTFSQKENARSRVWRDADRPEVTREELSEEQGHDQDEKIILSRPGSEGYEQYLSQKAEDILNAALGPGHGLVRIHAVSTYETIETTSEVLDPDSVLMREENIVSIPPDTPESSSQPDEKMKTQRLNYEIARKRERVTQDQEYIQKLNISVLVRQRETYVKQGHVFVPSRDQLKEIELLIKKAVGYDFERGDVFVLRTLPFALTGQLSRIQKWDQRQARILNDIQDFAEWMLKVCLGVVALSLITYGVWAGLVWLSRKGQAKDLRREQGKPAEIDPQMRMWQELRDIARDNPERVAWGIRDFVREAQLIKSQTNVKQSIKS